MMDPVLLVDVGNTSTVLALARGRRVGRRRRRPTREGGVRALREAAREVTGGRATAAVLSSVVPARTRDWSGVLERLGPRAPIIVNHRARLGIRIDYPRPAQIGGDRLANASGAFHRYGAPVLVADFGTALTFDVVSADGAYTGGVIAPGLPLMTDYLAERTALLRRIEFRAPRHGVGKSTYEAMCLGARLGYRGMVREIVNHLSRTLGPGPVTVCATGGHAEWVLGDADFDVVIDPTLTLFGMAIIHELNAPGT